MKTGVLDGAGLGDGGHGISSWRHLPFREEEPVETDHPSPISPRGSTQLQAQHDHSQGRPAHDLREPVQGCVNFGEGLLKTGAGANSRTVRIETDGVLVAKKDFEVKHQELDVKNLFVIKACQSLTSRGYLTTHFSWQYYYVSPARFTPHRQTRETDGPFSRPAQYVLTPEGIDYLREYLNIPAEVRSRPSLRYHQILAD